MPYIWIAIVFGVLVVPIISAYIKELEQKIDDNQEIKMFFGKVTTKEEAKALGKTLTYTVVIIFVVIVLVMISGTKGFFDS